MKNYYSVLQELEEAKVNISMIRDENQEKRDRISLLEKKLKEFTSRRNMNYEESYESVLREEFEMMRLTYEKQV